MSLETHTVITRLVYHKFEDLDLNWLKEVETVAVTAGASTPTPITKEVIDFLEAYDKNDPSTWNTTSHITSDKVLFKRK